MAGKNNKKIKILFAASEAEPFFKVGGLGDYAGSLPGALNRLSHQSEFDLDVRVVLPLHSSDLVQDFHLEKSFPIEVLNAAGVQKGLVFRTELKELIHYFIQQTDPPSPTTKVYGNNEYENAIKYAFFSLAIDSMLAEIDWQPDIIHANDWHTALICHLMRNKPSHKSVPASVLVIHNMPFMGYGSEKILLDYGVPPAEDDDIPAWAQHLPLPMGMASADKIVAVSPQYATELTTNQFAYGLERYFINNPKKVSGIINGIDYEKWNPDTDKHIRFNYSGENVDEKINNKKHLLEEFGLDFDPDIPLMIVISRLEDQKGIDLILDGLTQALDWQWQAIILGSGHAGYEHAFKALEREQPKRIRACMEYNPELARKLYAAGDMILMPSKYEPCGLSQMIAMRYGCVPIAHAVGGLKDTISETPEKTRTGYLFKQPISEAFLASIQKAIKDFQEKDKWAAIQKNGMSTDFSWDQSARKYARLYQQLTD